MANFAEDSSTIGLHKQKTNSIEQKELDIKNYPGQIYDGSAVMSGKYYGLHKKIRNAVHMLITCIVLRTIFFIYHIYGKQKRFTRKRIVSLYFGRLVHTRLRVAISKE